MFKENGRTLFLICIFYVGHIEPGIVRIDTIKTVDDKKITFLADNHELDLGEHEQVKGIIDWLQQNEKANEPIHILIEQVSWLADIYGCSSKVLFCLPKQIQQANPELTRTTFENIDIRHVGNFANDILIFPVPHQMNREPELLIETTQKTLGTLTFQDMLDEFTQTKESLSDYYSSQNNSVMTNTYTKHITWANESYEILLRIMKNNEIAPDIFVLKYAKKNCLMKKAPLASVIRNAFSPLCDLHLIRTLLTSPHKNMIVVAGARHTGNARSALYELNASSLYSAGSSNNIMNPKPITNAQLQQGLSAQKKSLMGIYAPVITKSAMAVVVCYFLYVTMLQMVMQTSIS